MTREVTVQNRLELI